MAAFSGEEGGHHAWRSRLCQSKGRGACGRGWRRSSREIEPEGYAAVRQEGEKRERGAFGQETEGESERGMGSVGASQRWKGDPWEANHCAAEQVSH